MKVLHLTSSRLDSGAGRGAYSLHKALQSVGVESNMLVAIKTNDDSSVYSTASKIEKLIPNIRGYIESLPLYAYPQRQRYVFSPSWLPTNMERKMQKFNPDLVNLHWVCRGFLNPSNLPKFNKPIIWTLRDMWAFTGGCHYTEGCQNYLSSCGNCPYLNSGKENDLSRNVWKRKLKHWENLNITIVALSHWLADCAKQSSLFKNKRVEVIHNALDAAKFKPLPKKFVRKILGLPQDKKIILYGAIEALTDKRKGFQYLEIALQQLAQNGYNENAEVVIFGSSKPENAPDLGMPITYMGRLHDDISLALVYAAADVSIVPSIQEAFGKTAMESLACGTPVVSFDSTGLKDIVEHEKNGYRATCFSADDLAKGIAWVLQDEQRWQVLSHRAREKVEQEFTLDIQARSYLQLYQEALQSYTLRSG
ncbi:glycosyltransferase family 4 protein [Argonema galeatum]|uniref:glycosyltransferase family 4 protein n=1 Tax=Argonema galeatum TaxID=2942762 RepID=UPI002011399B|nr:glycosyltransferase family 4 protein [Argonema galeatum]MCL1467694.1 glycosyltransferase family 4 protein [Argonema galeatum A003/A1]